MIPCPDGSGVCVHARQAKAALSTQVNETDQNDAYDFAQIVPGWCEPVEMKSLQSHGLRTLLQVRQRLAEMRRTAVQPRTLVAEGIQRGSPESQRFDVSPTGAGPSRATAETLTNVFLRAQDAMNDL